MLKLRFSLLLFGGCVVSCPLYAASFADSVVAYDPGVGFATNFSNGAGYTNTAAVIGSPSIVTAGQFGGPVDPFNPPYLTNQLLSLGTGGSLTVRFDRPIENNPANPFGLDFVIFGNAGFMITNGDFTGGGITDGSFFSHNPGQTRVSVSADNATYYLLNSTQAPTVDGLFPTDGSGDFSRPVNPALTSASFAGQGLAGIRSLYAGSGGGTGYDLSWAVDRQGRSVTLPSVSFVRVEVLEGHSEIDAFSVVPEPATWTLLLVGAGALWGWHRRKTRALDCGAVALCVWFCLIGLSITHAATVTEDFAGNPLGRGWAVFGDTSLFRWNPTNEDLEVTWDSSHPNSYWYRRLGTVVTKNDDFQLAFDLQLQSIVVGTTPGAPFTFELALGFLNLADATSTNFARGVGTKSPNLVEFDYFPDSGYGATIWPAIVSTNSRFSDSFTGIYSYTVAELTPDDRFHVAINYAASNQTLTTAMTRNGQPFGPIKPVMLSTNFTDFRVDAVAVCSYSDAGADGSIRARGLVDNLTVTVPDPPVIELTGGFVEGVWRVSFQSLPNWAYRLESTEDLRNWTSASDAVNGTGTTLVLGDAAGSSRFYRVRAERP